MKISFDKPCDEAIIIADDYLQSFLRPDVYISITNALNPLDIDTGTEKVFVSDFFIKSYNLNRRFKNSLTELDYDTRFICFKSIEDNPLGKIFAYMTFNRWMNFESLNFIDEHFFNCQFTNILSIISGINNGAIDDLPDNNYTASVIDIHPFMVNHKNISSSSYLLLKSDIDEFLVKYSPKCDFKLDSIDLLRT